MLSNLIKKVVYIRSLNLALIYYKKGKIEKMTNCLGLLEQARIENLLIEE